MQIPSDIVLRKGAEADIYLTSWYGNRAISKIRKVKPYRQNSLDYEIRRTRTVREATMLSVTKSIGIKTPFVYFVDIVSAEIIMEFIEGESVKETMNQDVALQMGKIAGLLHVNNIIHNDLTTSNFLKVGENQLVLLDFGLSFFSERLEDKAVDLRLVKEVLYSAYVSICHASFSNFLIGYSSVVGQKKMQSTLRKVVEIEQRGRYSRFT
ncbi:MAG: KEOPS complex kinase/ATPase Bud32 [Nitrososphaeraceae archaeon]